QTRRHVWGELHDHVWDNDRSVRFYWCRSRCAKGCPRLRAGRWQSREDRWLDVSVWQSHRLCEGRRSWSMPGMPSTLPEDRATGVIAMRVPLLDLKAQYATIRAEIRVAIDRVCESQHFILGPEVAALEEEIAAFCGARFAIGVSSGTDALLMCLMVL